MKRAINLANALENTDSAIAECAVAPKGIATNYKTMTGANRIRLSARSRPVCPVMERTACDIERPMVANRPDARGTIGVVIGESNVGSNYADKQNSALLNNDDMR